VLLAVAVAVVAAVPLPVELPEAVATAVPLPVELSLAVAIAVPLPVELPVAVATAVPLPVELPVAVVAAVALLVELSDPVAELLQVAEGDPVVVSKPLPEGGTDAELGGVFEGAGDIVETSEEEPDLLTPGVYVWAAEGDRLLRGDDDTDIETVFVFELVNDCDGLDECVAVLEVVVVLLADVETLGDFVADVLPV
jgi:hypothetical protein